MHHVPWLFSVTMTLLDDLVIFIVVILEATGVVTAVTSSSSPVIGILSQPFHRHPSVSDNNNRNVAGGTIPVDGGGGDGGNDYIAASYVKWLEAGGARSIPIPYNANEELLDDILAQINGVLLPGGASELPDSVVYLLDKIVESNLAGNYFPVWGTCLGFEFLVQYGATQSNIPSVLDSGFDAENISLPLQISDRDGLYANPTVYEIAAEHNVTMNNHAQGITPGHFEKYIQLTSRWKITSVNRDRVGRTFVSTMEPIQPDVLPIYGVQYHPEKNAFEYATYPGTNIPYEAIDHSEFGVEFTMYLARFFVDMARKSQDMNPEEHKYDGKYRYVNMYPIETGLGFEEIFILPSKGPFYRSDRVVQAR